MKFLLFLLIAFVPDITTEVVVTQEAKAARVIQVDDSVQVILTEPGETRTGFLVNVPNPSKFIRIKAQVDLFNVISPTRLDNTTWYFLAPPGTYAVTVTQFDPEIGIDEQYLKVVVGNAPNPPPVDPPPVAPISGMDRVIGLAPVDVVTTEMLIQLYKTANSPEEALNRRREIMRTRASYETNWNPFIVALNEELPKVDYIQGIRYLAAGLEKRVTTTCVNGVCYKTMK